MEPEIVDLNSNNIMIDVSCGLERLSARIHLGDAFVHRTEVLLQLHIYYCILRNLSSLPTVFSLMAPNWTVIAFNNLIKFGRVASSSVSAAMTMTGLFVLPVGLPL